MWTIIVRFYYHFAQPIMCFSCFVSWCFILLFFSSWQFDFFCEDRDSKKTDPGFFAEEELSMRSTEFWLSFCKSSVFHGKNTAHKKRTSLDSRTETRQINRSKHAGCTKRRTRRSKCCANRRSRKPHENIANRFDN